MPDPLPPVLEDVLSNDKCVYWAPTTTIGPDGRPILEPPVELGCFWEDKMSQYIKGNGEMGVSQSIVIVSDRVKYQGFLFHGNLNALTDPDVPQNNEGALEIQAAGRSPGDFDQSTYYNVAYL